MHISDVHAGGEPSAPPIVRDVAHGPGQPLDATTRAFMEARLGHDFSQVRVHSDAQASESARAVDALAYTVGRDVAFAAGRYAPATAEGRRLLAHELTHVVQQSGSSRHVGRADDASSSIASPVLQRQRGKATPAAMKRQQHLDELAREPGEAHRAWKTLSPADRDAVVASMGRRYGPEFSRAFLDEVKKGKPQLEVVYYQPGAGPAPHQLVVAGYRVAGREHTGNAAYDVQVWVHPSGRTIRRDVSTWKFKPAKPGTTPGTETKKPPVEVPPPIEEPPTETTPRHLEALKLLEDLHSRNQALQDSCAADDFKLDVAEDAQIEWVFSREQLRDFTDLDWRGVDPEFWDQVAAAAAENEALRATCCKLAPDNYWFDCKALDEAAKAAGATPPAP